MKQTKPSKNDNSFRLSTLKIYIRMSLCQFHYFFFLQKYDIFSYLCECHFVYEISIHLISKRTNIIKCKIAVFLCKSAIFLCKSPVFFFFSSCTLYFRVFYKKTCHSISRWLTMQKHQMFPNKYTLSLENVQT